MYKHLITGSLVFLCFCIGTSFAKPKKSKLATGADYKTYKIFNKTPKKSESHEKNFVTIYVNKTGFNSYKKLKDPLPAGTVIAKESFENLDGKSGKLLEIAIMKKLKSGSRTKSGDWYFATLKPDGTLKSENQSACIECHSYSSTDYIFGTK